MKIHEYQGKEILRRYGVPVPRGIACFDTNAALEAAKTLGGPVWVVKAQIHAGGRGKGGGVKVAKSLDEVRSHAEAIMGMQLVTHQTGPAGQQVRRLLIEEGADIQKELYVAAVTDRISQRVCLMGSSEGGMDIEEVAHSHPEKIHKIGQLRNGVSKILEDPDYCPDGPVKYRVADMITGFGVSESVKHFYSIFRNESLLGKKVIVQGWGNVASAAAMELAHNGAQIVGIIDRNGGLINESGYGLQAIKKLFIEHKSGNSLMVDNMLPFDEINAKIWDVPADIFIPAAA
ncbi:MAG: ADP-forming succinate--CoA ligase subunit beta, partial [Pseudomonadota bacterium]